MNPFAGVIAGFPIPWFALTLDAGLLVGVAIAARLARARGAELSRFLDASIVTLVFALVGSRAWYVAAHLDEYIASPGAVFSLWEGGLALAGAITLGTIASVPVARWFAVSATLFLDAWAIGAAAAQAIGRLGCLPAGCAAGAPAEALPPWLPVLALPDAAGAVTLRFPSQIAEATAEAALCLILALVWHRRLTPGMVAALYLTGYGAIRLLAEPLRDDSAALGAVSATSVWALLALAGGVVWLLALRDRERRARRVAALRLAAQEETAHG